MLTPPLATCRGIRGMPIEFHRFAGAPAEAMRYRPLDAGRALQHLGSALTPSLAASLLAAMRHQPASAGLDGRELVAQVRGLILGGQLQCWEMADPDVLPPHGSSLTALLQAEAALAGVDPGRMVQAPTRGSAPAAPMSAAIPASLGAAAGLPDTTDETCRADNWRSESHRTASRDVLDWLSTRLWEDTDSAKDQVLGHEGGGGFLATTCRIARLPKGTEVYRYYDVMPTYSSQVGGWWTTHLVQGDPRATLALPKGTAATKLCRARLGFDIEALTGVGAPRCSNKPGGPQQWYICFADRERRVLRDPDLALDDDPPHLLPVDR